MNDEKYVNPEIKPVPTPAEQPAKGLALASFLCGLGSVACCITPAAIVGLILGSLFAWTAYKITAWISVKTNGKLG
jgi:hypothetical protein